MIAVDKIKLYKTIVNMTEEYSSNLLKHNYIIIIFSLYYYSISFCYSECI
jgi:hypothetical protein